MQQRRSREDAWKVRWACGGREGMKKPRKERRETAKRGNREKRSRMGGVERMYAWRELKGVI